MFNIPRALEALQEIEMLTEDISRIVGDDYTKETISQDPDVCAAFEIIRMDLRARMPRCA